MANEPDTSRKRPAEQNDQSAQRKRQKTDKGGSPARKGKKPNTSKGANNAQRELGGAKNKNKGSIRLKSGASTSKDSNAPQKHLHNPGEASGSSKTHEESRQSSVKGPIMPLRNFRKLDPPRPFPTVPASVSATGPRSLHHEGKNKILVTRKTKLAAYLTRCKDLVIKDGYKSLHLQAMGAAISHLLTLSVSLPAVLPFPAEEIHTEVSTDTVKVNDEMFPTNDDEDFSLRTRNVSSVIVKITIGDGVDERPVPNPQSNSIGAIKRGKRRRGKKGNAAVGSENKGKEKAAATNAHIAPERIVVREFDQDSDADVALEDV